MSYLLDTNVISELARPTPNLEVIKWIQTIHSNSLFVSVLTLGELRKGIEKLQQQPVRKEKLKIWLENELIDWFGKRILDITPLVADRWGRLQAEMKNPLSAIDSLIAATALHHD